MLNTAGSKYDFGSVIFAVLEECEHRRRSYGEEEAPARLREVAVEKLEEIHRGYAEAGGTASYWQRLETEVLETVMPQYIEHAVAQNELERTGFGTWRGGDIIARILFIALGVVLGLATQRIPWVRVLWEPLTILFATGGAFYPEMRSWMGRRRFSYKLNDLILDGEAYQKNNRIHYLSEADLETLFEEPRTTRSAAAVAEKSLGATKLQ